MTKLQVMIAAVLPLLFFAACGEKEQTSHFVEGKPFLAACDNYSGGDHCHEYTGSAYSVEDARRDCAQNDGVFSTTQVCGPQGRGGRCTFLVGTGIEAVQSCYLEREVCERACTMVDANAFEPN